LRLRKELKQEEIHVICDTREQHPLILDPMPWERGTLVTGDYSVRGLEHKICVERKSLADLTQSLGRERERFDKEMHRILAYPHRCLVIEGTMDDVLQQRYLSRIAPNAVMSSLMGYASHGIPFVFCGTRSQMSDLVRRFLFISAQRIWRAHYDLISLMLQPVAEVATTPDVGALHAVPTLDPGKSGV